jgi:hypothetical protein
MDSFTPFPLFYKGKSSSYPLNRMLDASRTVPEILAKTEFPALLRDPTAIVKLPV